tara:strand:- start:2333 stop:3946 length:1614 start_codon:yes stop_codon:yes gene_type:complete
MRAELFDAFETYLPDAQREISTLEERDYHRVAQRIAEKNCSTIHKKLCEEVTLSPTYSDDDRVHQELPTRWRDLVKLLPDSLAVKKEQMKYRQCVLKGVSEEKAKFDVRWVVDEQENANVNSVVNSVVNSRQWKRMLSKEQCARQKNGKCPRCDKDATKCTAAQNTKIDADVTGYYKWVRDGPLQCKCSEYVKPTFLERQTIEDRVADASLACFRVYLEAWRQPQRERAKALHELFYCGNFALKTWCHLRKRALVVLVPAQVNGVNADLSMVVRKVEPVGGGAFEINVENLHALLDDLSTVILACRSDHYFLVTPAAKYSLSHSANHEQGVVLTFDGGVPCATLDTNGNCAGMPVRGGGVGSNPGGTPEGEAAAVAHLDDVFGDDDEDDVDEGGGEKFIWRGTSDDVWGQDDRLNEEAHAEEEEAKEAEEEARKAEARKEGAKEASANDVLDHDLPRSLESIEQELDSEKLNAVMKRVMLARAQRLMNEDGDEAEQQSLSEYDSETFFMCPVMVIFAATIPNPSWHRAVCLNASHLF